MKTLELLALARLLIKYRALYAMTHRFRDTVDVMCEDILQRCLAREITDNAADADDIPY